ncbi:MAG: hypothetical protein C5B59_04230 [Bacteroidetes bacterium]|nr:MAG: hypothetical protein C5B59_04230 [Bacteroidota bacterium]
MNSETSSLEALHDIKKMMERSSRFISLSGWSGIAAGICALVGAGYAHHILAKYANETISTNPGLKEDFKNPATRGEYFFKYGDNVLFHQLLQIAIFTFAAALILAFIFTYIRSTRKGVPMWGFVAKRLMWNTMLPLIAGGLVLLRMMQMGYFELVAPCSLVFYGLALIHASKYTLGEVRYLGYGELLLGLVSLWVKGYSIYFWAFGFGILHIIYGIIMWWKYERTSN